MRRGTGLAALAIAACVAACGGLAATPPPTSAPGATPPLGSAAVASAPAATGSSTVSAVHGAPGLEAMLPDAIGGVSTTKASFAGLPDGTGTTTFPPTHDGLAGMLGLLDKTPADLCFATATTGANSASAMVSVLQVTGVDAGQLAWMSGVSHASLSDVTIGGKPVRVQPGLEATYVIYEKGELLFLLQHVPVKDLASLLAGLP